MIEPKKSEMIDFLFTSKSIVFGFAVYEYIKIIALILKSKDFECFLTPPFILSFACFLILLEVWWDSYIDRAYISKNFLWFFLFTLEPLSFYLIAILLTPAISTIPFSQSLFIQNYFLHKNAIYIIGIFQLAVFISTSGLPLSDTLNLSRIVGILFFIILIIFSSAIVHYTLSIIVLILSIFFILTFCLKPSR